MRLVNDKVFKAVFGLESTKEILAGLLNAILDYTEDKRITELTLLNPFSETNYENDKTIIMDIKAKDKQGRYYNIEMQVVPPNDFVKRTVFYGAKLFSSQLQTGENYSELTKTLVISIISDKTVLPELVDFHNIFRNKSIKYDFELTDIIELHYIELNKFMKTTPDELKTILDKWLNFLKFGDKYNKTGEYPEELRNEKEIAMAIEQFGKVTKDERFIHYLEDIEKSNRDRNSAIAGALQEAELKGRLEGKLEGKLEGELNERIKIARGMYASEVPESVIVKLTGLTFEELRKLN